MYFIFLHLTVIFMSYYHMPYTQKQKFNPSLIIASLLFSLAAVAGVSYQQGELFSATILIITGFLLFLHGALLAARLQLIVNEEGIKYRFFPFHLKPHKIYWFEVEEAQLSTFSALQEFGGWGIRYNFFYGTKAFIAGSDTGLFLKIKDGCQRMFSISEPEQLDVWLPGQVEYHH